MRMTQDARWRWAVPEGGGGAAVAEAPESEGIPETTEPDETGEETAETVETPEAEADSEETPATTTDHTGTPPAKTVPLGSLVEIRRENAKLKERLEAMEQRLGETSSTVDKLKPPEKDALETWFEGLPDGDLESSNAKEKEAAELKQDAGLLLRVMKHPEFRKALFAPILPLMQTMFRNLDMSAFQVEQMVDAFHRLSDVEIGQAETDAAGNVVTPARRLGDQFPVGLTHRERIQQHHAELVRQHGGKWVPYKSAFDAVEAQLAAETKAAAEAGGKAAAAATQRTLKEVTHRRAATGGPRSEATPIRGGRGTPKRTLEQLEKAGVDFVLP